MANSNYLGNPDLAPEIQQRVQGTFRQTLDLAGKGSLREAQLGCDFVLRLDPVFDPARRLAEKLAVATGPVDVTEFQDRPPEVPPPAAIPGWNDDDLELPELPLLSDLGVAPAELRAQVESMLAARRFDEVVRLAESEADQVQADPELRRLVEQAQARLEAEPYVRPFLDSARRAAMAGNVEETEKLLRKVRALDPAHPEIFEVQRLLSPSSPPAPAAMAPMAPMAPPRQEPARTASDLEGFSLGSFDDEEMSPALERAGAADSFAGSGGFEESGAGEEGGADSRIGELLTEGQAAFERDEYQNAIDAWSRIFLIDIDHRDAARRIEQARRLKAEREREAEELFHESVTRFESRDREGARAGFARVLEIAPSYFAAREYLDKLDQVAARPAEALAPLPSIAAEPVAGGRAESKQEILVPPEPGDEAPRVAVGNRVAVAARRGSAGSRLFVLVGGAVLVAVLVGAWYLWESRERLFPNSRATPTPAAISVDPIAKARTLHAQGKTALAIAQLRRLPPDSPALSEARALISQWEALVEPKKDEEGPSAEQLARRSVLLTLAQEALAQGENIRAVMAFDQATAIAALEPELASLAGDARTRALPLLPELELFKRGEWEYLLNNLWRKREADPRNRDVARLMIDSYYNLGVRDLQRGESKAAGEKFKEAANIDPHDVDLQRLVLFSRTYEERAEDLLFRIFVKYLPER